MKILALDSSGLVASAAVVEDDVLIAEYTTDYKKTHSQTLLPMLDEIRQMIDLDLHTIDAIAISAGPGSFTGLRIGAATAKGLGLALNLPLVEVPTLEGLAFNLWGTDKLVCPIMDARRNQVYTGIYEFCKAEAEAGSCEQQLVMHCVKDQCASPVDELVDELNRLGREVTFLGDGVPVYRKQITEGMKVPLSFARQVHPHHALVLLAAFSYGIPLLSQAIHRLRQRTGRDIHQLCHRRHAFRLL